MSRSFADEGPRSSVELDAGASKAFFHYFQNCRRNTETHLLRMSATFYIVSHNKYGPNKGASPTSAQHTGNLHGRPYKASNVVGLVDHPHPPPAVARGHRLVFAATGNLKEAIGAPFVKGSSRGKQRQTMHGSAIPSQSRACVASGPRPETRVAELIQNSQCLPFAEAGFMAAQNSEEVVVITAALEQGTAPQSEANISMSHPPRSPVVHPVWAPQLYQAREPTTFELMGMIGDL
ncbi:hypothetical protein HYC85_029107 [Camellia sinensis]|uniref:Uncharacterized protein n=1 Tax=Camellia sinensis TaxID=4442 RepID=A0A7J7G125_CAMSI|nr:hypothetical protein HYC85_029107 [Camellia sinensis]